MNLPVHDLRLGALAGLVGGLVFGAAMTQLGLLPIIASLVRADSPFVGFVLHLVIAAVIGASFGFLVRHQQPGADETLFWGLSYGTFWWFLGPLTLLPLLSGGSLTWGLEAARAAFPSLLGHVLYGAGTGLTFLFLQRRRTDAARLAFAPLLRGALAGLASAWLLGRAFGAQAQLQSLSDAFAGAPAWLVLLLLGGLTGVSFALLYPQPSKSAGVNLVRGTVYGFLGWIVVMLTLAPLLSADGLRWSSDAAEARFFALPGLLLFGAATALFYQWLDALVKLLFSDVVRGRYDEGVGTQGVRAIGRGVVAGLVGGLLFTLVMVQIGVLPVVAALVGSSSAIAGFFVHLGIATLIGVSYGFLFRAQSYDSGSALGWGVSYGFFWWVLGPLTLMPLFLGGAPQWTTQAAAETFASLTGHLVYGAGLGLSFYGLEARYSPWWLPHTEVEAARVTNRKEQVLTASPALWVQVIFIALIIPMLLGG